MYTVVWLNLLDGVLNFIGRTGMVHIDDIIENFIAEAPENTAGTNKIIDVDASVDVDSIMNALTTIEKMNFIAPINDIKDSPDEIYMITQAGLDWIIAQAKVKQIYSEG